MMLEEDNKERVLRYPTIDDAALAAMNSLAASDEARALCKERSVPGAEDFFEKAAKRYVEKAKSIGLDPALWSTRCPADLCGPWGKYSSDKDNGALHGAFSQLMGGPNTARALEVLMEAGASPWLGRLPQDASAEQRAKEPSASDSKGVSTRSAWIASWVLAEAAMSKNPGLGDSLRPHPFSTAIKARKIILEAAVRGAAKFASQSGCIASVAEAYNRASQRASATSKGILGYADREAKEAAGIVLSLSKALEGSDILAGKQMLAAAAALWEAKTDKSNAAFDPAKIIRNLPEDKRERLQAIATLLAKFPADPEPAAMVLEGTHWLKEQPELASLFIPASKTSQHEGHSSILSLVLSAGNAPALASLERAGANIWLAAAQDGEANAPRWAISKWGNAPRRQGLGTSGEGGIELARMLLMGAWLSGEADPRAACLEKAREAASDRAGSGRKSEVFTHAVMASLEREELAGMMGEAIPPSESAAPAPKRRMSL